MGMGPAGGQGATDPSLNFWTLCLHTGLVRTNIGSLFESPVVAIHSDPIPHILMIFGGTSYQGSIAMGLCNLRIYR